MFFVLIKYVTCMIFANNKKIRNSVDYFVYVFYYMILFKL